MKIASFLAWKSVISSNIISYLLDRDLRGGHFKAAEIAEPWYFNVHGVLIAKLPSRQHPYTHEQDYYAITTEFLSPWGL